MTVANASNEIDFTGVSSTAPLTFPRRIDATTELFVYVVDVAGVETLRTVITDYTIVLATDYTYATVTPTAGLVAAVSGKKLRMRRTIPLSQSLDLANAARLNSAGIDAALDRAAMRDQQLDTRLGKAESSLNSAALASASATAASASATAAAGSATAASASASAASTSATASASSAAAALSSANNAAASAAAALISKGDANAYMSAAAASATAAAASAASATASQASATASQASATASAASSSANLISFYSSYLGPKAANPINDNYGGTLVEGQVYWNTVSKELRVYNGSTWSASVPGFLTSIFGRTGAIVALAGDYNASKITNDSGITGAFVKDALDTLGSGLNAVSSSAVQTLTNKGINASNNTISNLTLAMFAANVIDVDGTLTANSDTRVASQKATKTAIAAAVAALVASSPATLDTLVELAAALGNDPNFATTIATSIGLKADKASNLSDLASATTALTNLGLSANGKSLVTAANYAAMRTLLAITVADITDASANGRSLISAADYAAMRALLGLVIGTNVQAFDANTLKSNATAGLTAGYTSASVDAGSKSTGTFTPAYATGGVQHCSNAGAFALGVPTGHGSIILDITNSATAGAITATGFTKRTGDAFDTTSGHVFRCFITTGNGGSHLYVQALF